MTLPLLNVPTWATYIKGQLYLSEKKEEYRDTERHATFLPGNQVSTHFCQYSVADLPDALKIPLVPSCIFCDAIFFNFCVFCGEWHTSIVLLEVHRLSEVLSSLGQSNLPWKQLQPDRDYCESLASQQLVSASSKCGGIVSYQSSPQHQLRQGPDTLALLPPHSVSFPLP